MSKPKKSLITSINLGSVGDPARLLTEEHLRINGPKGFSAYIRKLLLADLSEDVLYKAWKVKRLLYERKELLRETKLLVDKRNEIEKRLEDMGINYE